VGVHDHQVVANTPEAAFYNGVAPEQTARAVGLLGLQSRASFEQPLGRAAWRELPSTYVICEDDQAIPLFAQEAMAQRASTVLRLPAGHSPFLAHPAELAALLRPILEAAG
jgi:pimeloyl-ACP methyl ester carboxylesterase